MRRLHANVHERGRDADLAREGHDGGGELALLRRVHRAVDHAHDAHGVHHPEHVFGEEGTDRAGHVPVVQPRLHERGGRLHRVRHATAKAPNLHARERRVASRGVAPAKTRARLLPLIPIAPGDATGPHARTRAGTRARECAASGGPTRRGRAEFLFVDFSAARRAPILSIVVHCTSLYTSRAANAASLCPRSLPCPVPRTPLKRHVHRLVHVEYHRSPFPTSSHRPLGAEAYSDGALTTIHAKNAATHAKTTRSAKSRFRIRSPRRRGADRACPPDASRAPPRRWNPPRAKCPMEPSDDGTLARGRRVRGRIETRGRGAVTASGLWVGAATASCRVRRPTTGTFEGVATAPTVDPPSDPSARILARTL